MSRTPGVVLPSFFSSEEELQKDIQRRNNEAGYTPLNVSDFKHSDVDDFLAHYGVKGMKWGVRNSNGGLDVRSSAKKGANDVRDKVKKEVAERTSQEITVRTRPGAAVQVVGGNKRTPHEDAIKARVAEQVAKKNTLDALSNKELGELVTRMNLEQQYRNLAVKEDRRSAGEKLVQSILSSKGSEAVAKLSGPQATAAQRVLDAVTRVGSNKALSNGVASKGDKKS